MSASIRPGAVSPASTPVGRMRPAIRWVLSVSLAEAAGFAVATAVAISAMTADLPIPVAFTLTVAGGAVEGALLGTGQWIGMGGSKPPRARWILATSFGAALAWTIGLLPSTLGADFGWVGTYPLLGGGGLALLATIPTAQWLAMRRTGTSSWVPVNMAAWAAAILWTLAPSPLIDERSPVAVVAVLYVLAGILMAITIALLTTRSALRLFPLPRVCRPSYEADRGG